VDDAMSVPRRPYLNRNNGAMVTHVDHKPTDNATDVGKWREPAARECFCRERFSRMSRPTQCGAERAKLTLKRHSDRLGSTAKSR
jgi:hypothetical protein